MKTILIATDFSAAAYNASVYAVEFAKAFNSKIILFHSFRFMYPPASSLLITSSAELKQNCEDELSKIAVELNEKAGGNLDIEVVMEDTTRISEAIVAKAMEKKASLIVVGMKGEGKTIRKIFGSTATSLSHISPVPILVIPQKATYSDPKTITLANDIDSYTDLTILEPLKKIGEKFSAKLLIARVVKNAREEVFERLHQPKVLKFNLSQFDPKYIFTVDENVAEGLGKCIEEHAVDLLVMIPHWHNLFERLFERSYTTEMLFLSHVPILILQDKITKTGKQGSVVSSAFDMEDYFAIE